MEDFGRVEGSKDMKHVAAGYASTLELQYIFDMGGILRGTKPRVPFTAPFTPGHFCGAGRDIFGEHSLRL